ncbi:MAG: hypothetical protein NTV88_03350 [Candidatus Micrarchaeota archaeon]|nr:hypothetical protein [Candidatus Micrarchaeota archaeon]
MGEIKEPEELREITITLDTYDDIFSDFDPRPYPERELSEDFLKEIQRRYMENKKGRFEVHFTVPSTDRDVKEEALIKKRLREHFAFMMKEEEDIIRKTKQRGYVYILIGAAVLLSDVFAVFWLLESNIIYKIISILLVPAGWYGMYTGLEKVIDEPFNAVDRKIIYEKFEKANYVFMSEELE